MKLNRGTARHLLIGGLAGISFACPAYAQTFIGAQDPPQLVAAINGLSDSFEASIDPESKNIIALSYGRRQHKIVLSRCDRNQQNCKVMTFRIGLSNYAEVTAEELAKDFTLPDGYRLFIGADKLVVIEWTLDTSTPIKLLEFQPMLGGFTSSVEEIASYLDPME